MRNLKEKVKGLFIEEDGYGTVEMILIVAGVGLLATGIFSALNTSIAGKEDGSTVNKVSQGIDDAIGTWGLEGD